MSQPTLLLVDDCRDFAEVAREVLEQADPPFSVHLAFGGRDALDFLGRRGRHEAAPRPDFIVLDFYLGDMQASSVLTWLRHHADLADVPVLVMTQTAWRGDREAAASAGANRYCAKPNRVDELLQLVAGFWTEVSHG